MENNQNTQKQQPKELTVDSKVGSRNDVVIGKDILEALEMKSGDYVRQVYDEANGVIILIPIQLVPRTSAK